MPELTSRNREELTMEMKKHEIKNTVYIIIGRHKSNGRWAHLAPEYIEIVEKRWIFGKRYTRHYPRPIVTREQAVERAQVFLKEDIYQDVYVKERYSNGNGGIWYNLIWQNGKWI
jgi:hypothetical protein